MPNTTVSLEAIVSLCKRRGFVFPTSEIYGGLTSSYDYGPLGAQLLKNIRDAWWHTFIESRSDMVGLDSQVMLHPQTWVASGHVDSFNDPLVEDLVNHKRYRADHLIEEVFAKVKEYKYSKSINNEVNASSEDLIKFLNKRDVDISLFQDGNLKQIRLEPFITLLKRKDEIGEFTNTFLNNHAKPISMNSFRDSLFSFLNKNSSDLEHDELNAIKELIIWSIGSVENLNVGEMKELIQNFNVKSSDGNPVSEPKQFNLLFETAIGSVADEKAKVYLRGETAQGIFTNFKQVLNSSRVQLPFGIGQIGKSFRNEVTTGQFVFRTLELEQAEIEYFFDPDKQQWEAVLDQWKQAMWQFVTETLGISTDHLQWRRHTESERSFYSKDTYDLDYAYPFGYKELWGVAYRTDYDLTQHQKLSGEDLSYRDPQSGKTFIPHVIEPALGVGRALLMVLCDAYWEDTERQRIVLKLKPELAPVQVTVFPLLKNKPELVAQAQTVFDQLKPQFRTTWDDRGNIGKRYLYQDEIGTPYCITVDFQTLDDQTVTVRHRDTTAQERVSLDSLATYLKSAK